MSLQLKKLKGFTLIELMIVIAMLAGLAAFVILRFTGAQAGARDARRQSDIKQYQNAFEIYSQANNGAFPDGNPTVNAISLCGSGQALGNIPCTDDPVTSTNYRYSTNAANTQYVLWATLEKPTPTQVFYVCSNGFTGTAASATFTVNNGVCP